MLAKPLEIVQLLADLFSLNRIKGQTNNRLVTNKIKTVERSFNRLPLSSLRPATMSTFVILG